MSDTKITNHSVLPSIYVDFTDQEFSIELHRTLTQTALDLQWMDETGAKPYQTDDEILASVELDGLVRVDKGVGYIVINRLLNWDLSRSDPRNEHYYSPPYLAEKSFSVLEDVAEKWQSEIGESRYLAVTSLVRSQEYQTRLCAQRNKLTGARSSHTVGWSFDIDGCGLYEKQDNGEVRPINPRAAGYTTILAQESSVVLRGLLNNLSFGREDINVVEELVGTSEHCFHVCVRPD